MKKISISELKYLSRRYNLSHIILFCTENHETNHIVTYGRSVENSDQATDAGNRLKDILKWPKSLFTESEKVKELRKYIRDLENENTVLRATNGIKNNPLPSNKSN